MSTGGTIAFQKRGIQCRRCNGLMGLEKFYGPNYTFFGYHCLLCGDILDPVILLNRLRPRPRHATPEKNADLVSMFKKVADTWPEPA